MTNALLCHEHILGIIKKAALRLGFFVDLVPIIVRKT